jgi:hypothetical protein
MLPSPPNDRYFIDGSLPNSCLSFFLHGLKFPIAGDIGTDDLVRIITEVLGSDKIHLPVINDRADDEKNSQRKLEDYQCTAKNISAR